ncbi:hypothetical protein [Tessaracoccus antarcticus]|nr:hypothetical protein [Tessaracoccus antarcticus]
MTSTRTAAIKLLIAVGSMAALLITGLGFAIHFAIADTTPTTASTDGHAPDRTSTSVSVRDAIADAPMMTTTAADATSGTPALTPPPTLVEPASTSIGALGVASGFPHTPNGAAAQLGEILVATLQPMDLAWAQEIRQSWFQKSNQGQVWPVMLLIQGFLKQAGMPLGLEADALMTVTPVAAQIKGVDGPDWVVACVLLDVTYTSTSTARLAYGHCERMAWEGGADGRWLIAPGSHPPPAPSTWPGTDLAAKAGWRTWVQEG